MRRRFFSLSPYLWRRSVGRRRDRNRQTPEKSTLWIVAFLYLRWKIHQDWYLFSGMKIFFSPWAITTSTERSSYDDCASCSFVPQTESETRPEFLSLSILVKVLPCLAEKVGPNLLGRLANKSRLQSHVTLVESALSTGGEIFFCTPSFFHSSFPSWLFALSGFQLCNNFRPGEDFVPNGDFQLSPI